MVSIEARVGMERFRKFLGAIDEIVGISTENVIGVYRGVGMAPLRHGNDEMEADTANVEDK